MAWVVKVGKYGVAFQEGGGGCTSIFSIFVSNW